jgi:PH (Pleckstrin Homology) domain-containing protein
VADAEYRWRVPRKVPGGKLVAAAVVLGLAALSASEPWLWAGVAVVTAGLAGWALRDLVAPVRLAADPSGLTVVTGFAHRLRLAWSQVDRVRVDVRRRSRLLEVDAGERLYLFSRYEVDADLDEVAERLESLRADAGGADHSR